MRIAHSAATVVVCGSLLASAPARLLPQEPESRLWVSFGFNETDPPCGEVEVLLDNAVAVEAFDVAVCHNAALITPESISPGPAAEGAELVDFSVSDDGAYLRVVMEAAPGGAAIPPGDSQPIATIRYCCDAWPDCYRVVSSALELCDGAVGEPPVENRIVSGGIGIGVAEGLLLEDGAYECVGECPPPDEDCRDGVDNDDDGLVDCDDPFCRDDRACRGRQVPGDCNQDGLLDISDALCVFGYLFLGDPPILPCEFLPTRQEGNRGLLDWQPDGKVDLSDGIGVLQFLFAGGPPHPRALPGAETRGCVEIFGCPDSDVCRQRCVPPPSACPGEEPRDLVAGEFIRGDVDRDGTVGISDPIALLNWLCIGGPEPPCLDAADTDDDGCITLSDIQRFPLPGFCPFLDVDVCRPAPPYPEAGPDPALDYLGCGP